MPYKALYIDRGLAATVLKTNKWVKIVFFDKAFRARPHIGFWIFLGSFSRFSLQSAAAESGFPLQSGLRLSPTHTSVATGPNAGPNR